jgi:uncharacterized membrane protein YeaQ/YmgE (transglycosylase-associated protein family)
MTRRGARHDTHAASSSVIGISSRFRSDARREMDRGSPRIATDATRRSFWFSMLSSRFSVLTQEVSVDLLQLLILLVIAGICGAVAELIVGFSPPGLQVMLVSIIVGVIGAFIGGWIAGTFGLPPITEIRVGNIRLNLLYTILGSTLLLVILQALRSGRQWFSIKR